MIIIGEKINGSIPSVAEAIANRDADSSNSALSARGLPCRTERFNANDARKNVEAFPTSLRFGTIKRINKHVRKLGQ